MAITPSPSRSPSLSRSRAKTINASPQGQNLRPKFSSVDLPSREPSQTRYSLHTSYQEDLRLGRGARFTDEPRYVENYLESSHANDNFYAQCEASTNSPSESGQHLTPLTNTSSRKSEDGELKKPPDPSSPCSRVQPGLEELQSHALETSGAMEEIDSFNKMESMDFPQLDNGPSGSASALDNKMDDEYYESESEADSVEERWVPTYEDLEVNVFRATGNNLDLAARLIPQLYEMFQQEESSVVDFLETCYRQSVENSYGQGSKTSGGGASSFSGYTGQDTNNRKRQRKDDEDNGEEENNSQEGNRDSDPKNTKSDDAEGSNPRSFACPFNKRHPKKYNGTYRSLNGKKGEYRTCDAGFDNDTRFKEHLKRQHRFVQCENCSRLFTDSPGNWKIRQIAFQTHRSKPQECGQNPSDVNEGITELQWAQIEGLPRQPRSTAPQKLNVDKWYSVWKILFPGEQPPHPWHTPNTNELEQLSSLDVDLAEFRICYDSVVNAANEHLRPEEIANRAFEKWWTQRWVEQQNQQKMSQVTLQDCAGTQNVYSLREEDRSHPSTSFPNKYPSQGRAEMPRFPSHQQPLQNSLIRQSFQGMTPLARRNVTDTNLGNQEYRQTSAASQPGHLGPDAIYPPVAPTTYQPQGVNSTMMNTGRVQPQSTYFDDIDRCPASQEAQQRNYEELEALMNGSSWLEQTSSTPLPLQSQHLTGQTSQPQEYTIHQAMAYDGPSGSRDSDLNGSPPAPYQSWTIPTRRRRPERSYQSNSATFPNPNGGYDAYGN